MHTLSISYAKRDDVPTLTLSLVRALKRAQTRLVFFDEIQQLTDATGASANMVKNWLKNLIDEAGVPIVFLGLPHGATILSGDELGRRVTPILSMDPFEFPNNKQCLLLSPLRTLSEYLLQDVNQSYLQADAPIPFAQRMWAATGGRISPIRTLLFNASLRAEKSQKKIITLKELGDAYAAAPPDTTQIKKGNPFEMSADAVVSRTADAERKKC